MSKDNIEIGDKIKFIKYITDDACGDHPELLYAKVGETGEIVDTSCGCGYLAKTDGYESIFLIFDGEFVKIA